MFELLGLLGLRLLHRLLLRRHLLHLLDRLSVIQLGSLLHRRLLDVAGIRTIAHRRLRRTCCRLLDLLRLLRLLPSAILLLPLL